MAIAEALIQEFQHEAGLTKKLIERIPEDKFDFKPHPKSMSLGELASHLVDIIGWTEATMNMDVFEFDPTQWTPFKAANRKDLLEHYNKNLEKAVAALEGRSDAHLMKNWQMKVGGRSLFEMPRVAVVRGMMLNHQVHHRGQLTVYLRLNDVPLPALYGPSADEPNF